MGYLSRTAAYWRICGEEAEARIPHSSGITAFCLKATRRSSVAYANTFLRNKSILLSWNISGALASV
jgi:hypothetical protein